MNIAPHRVFGARRTIVLASLMFAIACAPGPSREQPERPTIGVEGTAGAEAIEVERDAPAARQHFSFGTAKARLRDVYLAHPVELYCGCGFAADSTLDAASCGYEPRNHGVRGRRIEWEHIVPAARFGRDRECWDACEGESGRECCARPLASGGDEQFRWMLGDMHNLVPANGQLNADRSDRDYGEVDGEMREYGLCDFEIAWPDGVAEPPDDARGDVARVWLYMADEYAGGLTLSDDERAMYEAWSAADAVDQWEIDRDEAIALVQGNHNPYVIAPE